MRYRCDACGNLTRFDVLSVKRSRAFHHYTLGGEVRIDEEEILSEQIEKVTCRWCGASDQISRLDSLTDDLHDDASLPGPVVAVDQNDLLPGS